MACSEGSGLVVNQSHWNEQGGALDANLGPHIGAGPVLPDPTGANIYGELGLENWSNMPIMITSIQPLVRSGELEVIDYRVLGIDREDALFDVLPGTASEVFPESTALNEHVFEPVGDWNPEEGEPLGDQVLMTFRNLSDSEDLWVEGFAIEYRVGDEMRTLLLENFEFVSCLRTTPIEECGAAQTREFVEGDSD